MNSTHSESASHHDASTSPCLDMVAPPCAPLAGREGRCLILAFRHLGDAVITTSWVRGLQRDNPSLKIDVLGRPELREIFTDRCKIESYHAINLPIFGHHRRDLISLVSAVRCVLRMLQSRYTFCINLVGDTRENLIGMLIAPQWNIAPIWSPGHPFKEKVTDGGARRLANSGIVIPPHFDNYYKSLDVLAQRLGLRPIQWSTPDLRGRGKNVQDRISRVALHPGASHPSRHWPAARWKQLMHDLAKRGCRLQLLGSPQDEQHLRDTYRLEIEQLSIDLVTTGMTMFFAVLAEADLLIGMDSMSAHAAYSLGIRSVVMNGSSDPRIMTPPGSVPLSAGNLCACFPCNYAYSCKKEEQPYTCCRGIEVADVLKAVDHIALRSSFPSAPTDLLKVITHENIPKADNGVPDSAGAIGN